MMNGPGKAPRGGDSRKRAKRLSGSRHACSQRNSNRWSGRRGNASSLDAFGVLSPDFRFDQRNVLVGEGNLFRLNQEVSEPRPEPRNVPIAKTNHIDVLAGLDLGFP